MTDLSIIIISYNTRDITKKSLETVVASLNSDNRHSGPLRQSDSEASLTRVSNNKDSGVANAPQNDQEVRTEIIVLDNASTDGSIQMLKTFEKRQVMRNPLRQSFSEASKIQIKLIESKINLGFAKGNNEAVKEAEGKYLLFLNSDTEAIADAIPKLYHYFTNQSNFAFTGPKLLEKDGVTPQPSAGPFFNLPTVFTALFLRGDYWGLTRYSPQKTQQVDWVSGACLMCHKTDFEQLGGFDEKIFMYMEEVDLLYRAKQQSLKTGFYPGAKFIHLGSASSSTGRSEPIIKVFEGLIYFYKKHYSPAQLKLLQYMLMLKCQVALAIGKIFGNNYLTTTYEKAKRVVKETG